MYPQQIIDALRHVRYPGTGKNLIESGMLEDDLRISVPRKLLAICDRFRDSPEAMMQAGIAYATDQIIDLISNGVRGIHIYTMNKPEIAQAIIHNVDDIIKAIND